MNPTPAFGVANSNIPCSLERPDAIDVFDVQSWARGARWIRRIARVSLCAVPCVPSVRQGRSKAVRGHGTVGALSTSG